MTKPTTRKHIRANGTDIHYVEAGDGPPLLLIHGGLMSTDAVWDGFPGAYGTYLDAFAARFRVIAPDTRGHGRTLDPGGGSIGYAQLADDVLALAAALGLDRPLLCGFSDGGAIATVAAVRAPAKWRAIVNDAGFDLLNPRSHSFAMARSVFGAGPQATKAIPEAAERFLVGHGMGDLMRRLQEDHAAQAPNGWKTTLENTFDRFTSPLVVTFDDLKQISSPTLVLTGDRDMACTVEDAVTTFRMLSAGELAIIPGFGHMLSDAAIAISIDFLQRHAAGVTSTG
jgi:pimeloyl-ACP methyl ester carboxylesterase